MIGVQLIFFSLRMYAGVFKHVRIFLSSFNVNFESMVDQNVMALHAEEAQSCLSHVLTNADI